MRWCEFTMGKTGREFEREKKKTTFLQQQMRLAVYGLPMGDSNNFTFATRQPYSSHQPTKHYSITIAYRRHQSPTSPKKISPRDFQSTLTHASLEAPGLHCFIAIQHVTWPQAPQPSRAFLRVRALQFRSTKLCASQSSV